ncbi:Transcription factor GRAS [Dillenia turbinata]|uniref:Transcription factor GRAS n=1 Tax=Dillenia turbinata TaxID=194707 RepID=A0AAN8V079_9MAGN
MEEADALPFTPFILADNGFSSSKWFEESGGGAEQVQSHLYVMEGFGVRPENDILSSAIGGHQDHIASGCPLLKNPFRKQQEISFGGFGIQDGSDTNLLPPSFGFCSQVIRDLGDSVDALAIPELAESQSQNHQQYPISSLELLNNFGSGVKRLNIGFLNTPSFRKNGRELSTIEIMMLAGAKFIQSSSSVDVFPMLSHPFDSSFAGLSYEQTKDMELVLLLLSSAKKIEHHQFSRALKLLDQCDMLSSNSGNPVERLVHYLCEALRQRIGRAIGTIRSKRLRDTNEPSCHLQEELTNTTLSTLKLLQEAPFLQVAQFTGVQAILEQVASAKKWIDFMQALAAQNECPVASLKITALATSSENTVRDTGKRLTSFAESLNIPFLFQVVTMANMKDIDEELFELDADEVIAVCSSVYVSSLIAQPDLIGSLMRVIKCIRPCIMVVIEVEANHNSLVFVNRFVATLFYHGAFFDCFDDCMDRYDPIGMILEKMHFSKGIQNIVAAEGVERTMRREDWRLENIFLAIWNGGGRNVAVNTRLRTLEWQVFLPQSLLGSRRLPGHESPWVACEVNKTSCGLSFTGFLGVTVDNQLRIGKSQSQRLKKKKEDSEPYFKQN